MGSVILSPRPNLTGVPSPLMHVGLFKNRTILAVDFSVAAWSTIATHTVFTVSGAIQFCPVYICTASLTSAGAATLACNVKGSATMLSSAIAYSSILGGAGAGGNYLLKTAAGGGSWGGAVQFGSNVFSTTEYPALSPDSVGANWSKIGYTIAGAAMNGGTILFGLLWNPLTDGASVAASDGSAY